MYVNVNPITNRICSFTEIRREHCYPVNENDPVFEEYKKSFQTFQDNEKYYYFNNRIIKKDSITSLERKLASFTNYQDQLTFLERREKRYLKKLRRKIRILEDYHKYTYFLSIVTIVRDENDYIEEWIRYHIEDAGINHFYIYDNESKVPVKEYLKNKNFKYYSRCTFIDWETTEWSQQDSLNHFLQTFKDETRWMITIDPDEYLIPQTKLSIPSFLRKCSWYGGVHMHWIHYGANGQEKKTSGTDIERFPKDSGDQPLDSLGKHFIQTYRVTGFHDHVPDYAEGFVFLDYPQVKDFIHLNHYITRSYEEWNEKMRKGTVNLTHGRKFYEFFQYNPDMKYLLERENVPDYVQKYCPKETPFFRKVAIIIKYKFLKLIKKI